MSVVTSTPLTIDHFITDLSAFVSTGYDSIRWYRSRGGENGAYEAATGTTAAAASLTCDDEPYNIAGKTLSLMVNGDQRVDVTFASPAPIDGIAAGEEICGGGSLLTYVVTDGRLVLSTVETGSDASIEVLESDAAPYMGLVIGQAALGLDADTAVNTAGTTQQFFYTDSNSDADFWYRVEYRSTTSAVVSELGGPFPATRGKGPLSETVPCYVRLTGMNGQPLVGQVVSFFNAFVPNTVTANTVRWGIFRDTIDIVTDSNGYAETRLLRGLVVDINFGGTGLTRRIQVPTDAAGEGIDLLDPNLVTSDEFGIAEPSFDWAIRTS